jgi:hypothetical protein
LINKLTNACLGSLAAYLSDWVCLYRTEQVWSDNQTKYVCLCEFVWVLTNKAGLSGQTNKVGLFVGLGLDKPKVTWFARINKQIGFVRKTWAG